MKKIIIASFFTLSFNIFAATNHSQVINAAFEKEEEAVCNTVTVEEESDLYIVACKSDYFGTEYQFEVTINGNEIIGYGDVWTKTEGSGYCTAEGIINPDGTAEVKTRCVRVQD